jgi:hypothetical protein
MAEKKQSKDVPFNIERGSPIVLRAEARGKLYRLRIVLSVAEIIDTFENNDDGTPKLMVATNMNIKINEYEG